MIKAIKFNLVEVEAMLYFWQATNEREKVAETYLHEVASMPGLSASYDSEFDSESVRKVLSAITNKELLSSKTLREGRFWNNNMWMMEDLSYTAAMVAPLKTLNIDDLVEELNNQKAEVKYDEVEVLVSPLSTDEYIIKGNRLIINFFKIRPLEDESLVFGEVDLKRFLVDKIKEM